MTHRRILIVLKEEEFNVLKEYKDLSSSSWKDMLYQALEANKEAIVSESIKEA